jgi:hypothetical protein
LVKKWSAGTDIVEWSVKKWRAGTDIVEWSVKKWRAGTDIVEWSVKKWRAGTNIVEWAVKKWWAGSDVVGWSVKKLEQDPALSIHRVIFPLSVPSSGTKINTWSGSQQMVYFYPAQKVLFYIAHTQTIVGGCVFDKRKKERKKYPYLERQSALVFFGEFPFSQVPCLKSTVFVPLALPSATSPASRQKDIYLQTDDINMPATHVRHRAADAINKIFHIHFMLLHLGKSVTF